MHDSKHKGLLVAVFGGLLVIGAIALYWWQRDDAHMAQPQSDSRDFIEVRATDALKAVVDAANEVSNITSGTVFTFEPENPDGRFTNFGIVRYRDEVRADTVVEEHAFIFREVGGDGRAEVDRNTYHVASIHRRAPDFVGGEYPADEIEKTARQFLSRVYPEFASIESSLTFDSGTKGVRLNNGNYFFRWNDEQFALPTGLAMDIPPRIQIGITSSGFIFGYDNTVELYHNLPKEALRTLCGYVEMPKTDDSSLDQEKGIVKVWFTEYEPFQNRYLLLPYEPETDFEGCTESAKTYLRHLPTGQDKDRN